MINILYLFGGEKAQGAEIVIERLMADNRMVNSHLILAPGVYANQLLANKKPYQITILESLKKLNRNATDPIKYLANAISKFFTVPVSVHQYIQKHQIQVVHTNTIAPTSYLSLLVIFYRLFKPEVKFIWSDHDLRYFTRLEKYLASCCVALYHRTIVVSEAVSKKYKNLHKVFVLYNGLDVNLFRPDHTLRSQFRTRHIIEPKEVIVGIAAVIHEDKGQLALIRAFNEITPSKNAKLMLAGNFADINSTYAQLVKTEIENNENIIYLGFVEHTSEFYNGCDVLVNNSNSFRSESLGTSIYEAMSCEKIVLCAETGGTAEIINDGVDGFLFKVDNVESLSLKLEHIVSNFPEFSSIQKSARQKVVDKFNIVKMVDNYNRFIFSKLS